MPPVLIIEIPPFWRELLLPMRRLGLLSANIDLGPKVSARRNLKQVQNAVVAYVGQDDQVVQGVVFFGAAASRHRSGTKDWQ